MLCIVILLLLMWVVARIGILLTNGEELMTSPLTGWRKSMQHLLYGIGQALCFCMGFHKITKVGEQVNTSTQSI